MARDSTFQILRLCAAGAFVIASLGVTNVASAQALRAPSATSLAAGPTAERNSLPTPATTGLPGVTARQSTSTGTGSSSGYAILGMPLRVSAPVNAPYNSNAAYSTFAGQSATGKDAVLQESIDGAP